MYEQSKLGMPDVAIRLKRVQYLDLRDSALAEDYIS